MPALNRLLSRERRRAVLLWAVAVVLAAAVILALYLPLGRSVGNPHAYVVAYGVGGGVLAVARGTGTATDASGWTYHRSRSIRGRAGDLAISVAAGLILAASTAFTVGPLAGPVLGEAVTFGVAIVLTETAFGWRRPDYESRDEDGSRDSAPAPRGIE